MLVSHASGTTEGTGIGRWGVYVKHRRRSRAIRFINWARSHYIRDWRWCSDNRWGAVCMLLTGGCLIR
eukprot:XP_001705210.1 Hypothetical protein GL50803_38691 [Giardia lamblia ATCC 50803]